MKDNKFNNNNNKSEDNGIYLPDEEIAEEMEKMNFDFEALPPSEEDIDGLECLLTQVDFSKYLLKFVL
jgi:hypothetical protein